MKTLLVLGATGLMGRRICALSERDLGGVRIVRASRSSPDGALTRRIDLRETSGLEGKLSDVDCLINAAGPYDYDPRPLLAACGSASCHYIDLAESPDFCDEVSAAVRELGPRARGVAFLPGCSTVPALVDLVAQRWSSDERVASIDAWLSMGSRNPSSPTLLYSLLRIIRGRAPDGQRYFSSLHRRRAPDGRDLAYGRYPFPGEAAGLRVGERCLPVTFHAGFDRRVLVRGLVLGRPVVERVRPATLLRLSRASHPLFAAVSRLGTSLGCLEIVARDARRQEMASVAIEAREEGLDIPAAPTLWSAGALLRTPSVRGGLTRLPQLIGWPAARGWLAQQGYIVTESDSAA